MSTLYKVDKETVRPFRLYDAVTKKYVRYRNYKVKDNAHIGALIQARWAAVGTTLEVVNFHKGTLIGQYTRGVNDIKFLKG